MHVQVTPKSLVYRVVSLCRRCHAKYIVHPSLDPMHECLRHTLRQISVFLRTSDSYSICMASVIKSGWRCIGREPPIKVHNYKWYTVIIMGEISMQIR